jgi:hypothetical protein
MVIAGGNEGYSSAYMTNRGFNTLIVGASNTVGDTNLGNDTVGGLSSWKNPSSTHNDRELPYLVAPGDPVGVATEVGCSSGTSFATPQVASAAMMVSSRDSMFSVWPEMVRATIMATAVHNVDAGAFVALGFLGTGDLKDGVGALQAAWAVDLANVSNRRSPGAGSASKGRWGMTLSFSTFQSGYGPSWNVSVAVTGRLRAALAWDATATVCSPEGLGSCNTDTLDADLELYLYDSMNNLVSYSNSWDSSWEAIDIPVTAGQTYRLQIYKTSQNYPTTYAGIAWYNYQVGTE